MISEELILCNIVHDQASIDIHMIQGQTTAIHGMLVFCGLFVITLANIISSSADAKNDSEHGTFHFDLQHKLRASIVSRVIATIHNCADEMTSVFIK